MIRALTICQPWAHLILHGSLEVTPELQRLFGEAPKRVENRGWAMQHRGRLLIHAGAGRKWFSPHKPHSFGDNFTFGAFVGDAEVVECQGRDFIQADEVMQRRYPWLLTHPHAHGPWCIVLANRRRLVKPIPYRGQQGLFNVPESLFADSEWVPLSP